MRFALFLALIVSALTVLGLSYRSYERPDFHRLAKRLRDQKPPTKWLAEAASATPDSENNPSWTVEGMGPTRDEARQDALEKAQAKIIGFLRERNPPLECVPPLSYIRENLVTDETEGEPRQLDSPVGRVTVVRMSVELTPKARGMLVEMDRHSRMEHRMLFTALLLGALVTVLAAVAGYVRLDEWSKGYYTNWLRLAAAGFVGGAVILMLLFA